jgi:hypothetical protein
LKTQETGYRGLKRTSQPSHPRGLLREPQDVASACAAGGTAPLTSATPAALRAAPLGRATALRPLALGGRPGCLLQLPPRRRPTARGDVGGAAAPVEVRAAGEGPGLAWRRPPGPVLPRGSGRASLAFTVTARLELPLWLRAPVPCLRQWLPLPLLFLRLLPSVTRPPDLPPRPPSRFCWPRPRPPP